MRPLLTSLTRIADFERAPFEIQSWSRNDWATSDYVLGEVLSPVRSTARLELTTGRETTPSPGDFVIGALGARAATLEAVGNWQHIENDNVMQAMTAAGLFGRITSMSQSIGDFVELRYVGHVTRDGAKVTMQQFVQPEYPPLKYNCATVLIIGTSMSAGKTKTGGVIVRILKQAGLKVVGVKLTGAGRYRDMLAWHDAGADAVFDFVDCGLPSTVCPREEYETALELLLSKVAAVHPDVVVAEAGASPLEPYNGKSATLLIEPHVCCTVLCASDPYAVVGVTQGFGFDPDFVSGVATSTSAGCAVVEELSGLPAINALDPTTRPELERLLLSKVKPAVDS